MSNKSIRYTCPTCGSPVREFFKYPMCDDTWHGQSRAEAQSSERICPTCGHDAGWLGNETKTCQKPLVDAYPGIQICGHACLYFSPPKAEAEAQSIATHEFVAPSKRANLYPRSYHRCVRDGCDQRRDAAVHQVAQSIAEPKPRHWMLKAGASATACGQDTTDLQVLSLMVEYVTCADCKHVMTGYIAGRADERARSRPTVAEGEEPPAIKSRQMNFESRMNELARAICRRPRNVYAGDWQFVKDLLIKHLGQDDTRSRPTVDAPSKPEKR